MQYFRHKQHSNPWQSEKRKPQNKGSDNCMQYSWSFRLIIAETLRLEGLHIHSLHGLCSLQWLSWLSSKQCHFYRAWIENDPGENHSVKSWNFMKYFMKLFSIKKHSVKVSWNFSSSKNIPSKFHEISWNSVLPGEVWRIHAVTSLLLEIL
jgi:hypothetical protein